MSDVQYIIDVAAEMSGQDSTAADLDDLAAKFLGMGAKSSQFEDALGRLESDLMAAGAATKNANQELDKGRAALADLEGAAVAASREYEKIAKAASKSESASSALAQAQTRLSDAIKNGAGSEKIAQYQQQLTRAKRAADQAAAASARLGDAGSNMMQASAAVTAYKGTLERLQIAAQQAAESQDALKTSMSNVRRIQSRVDEQLGDATTNLSTFRGALGDVGGPLGEFGEKLLFPAQAFVDLREKFGSFAAAATVGVVGIAAVAAAVVALTAALVAGAAALTAYGIKMADTARSASLTRDAFNAYKPALRAVSGEYSALTNATGVAETELRELSLSLLDAKVSAADLPAALRAAALAEKALGQGGSAEFIQRIREGTLSVREFAAESEQAFGVTVARMMLSTEEQSARLSRNFAGLFSSLEIDSALGGMNTLVDLFDETSVTGRLLKSVLEGLLQPIIDQAQNAAYVIEAFSLGALIAMTKIYIAVKPVIDRIAELLGLDTSSWELGDVLEIAAKAGELAVPFFLSIVAALAGIALWLGIVVAAAVAWVAAIVGGVALVVAGIVWVGVQVVQLAIQFGQSFGEILVTVATAIAGVVTSIGSGIGEAVGVMGSFASRAVTAGRDLIMGFVSGITSSAGAIVSSISSVMDNALSAAKSVWGIASPSREAASIMQNVTDTASDTLDDEADNVQDAAAAALAPPRLDVPSAEGVDVRSAVGTGSSGSGGSGSNGPVVKDNTFNFYGVADARDGEGRMVEAITRLLRGDADQMGGATT